MPEFAPGEAKMAVAPITVSPSGLACQAEVFLGPDEMTKVVTSGLVPFTSTGMSQDVSLPVTMPSAEGNFHVFIDVYAEGILIAAYQAIEDVVITGTGEVAIESFSPPMPGYSGAYCPFEAVCFIPSPALIKIYIQEEDLPSGCDRDLVLLYASSVEPDPVSPDNLYSLTGKAVMAYHWYGKVTATGWAARTKFLPAGSYPVRGYISQVGGVISDEVIGSLTITTSSASSFSYSDSYLNTLWVNDRLNYEYGVTITNNGTTTRTADILCWIDHGYEWYNKGVYTVTLAPGQSYDFRYGPKRVMTGVYLKAFVIDDLGGKSPIKTKST